MRIALATTSLNRYGGAASFQDHLAGQLRSIGHEVTQYRIGRMNDTKAEIICVDRSVIKRKDQAFVAPEELTCRWPELWDRHDVVHVTNPGCLHSGFDWDQLFGRKYGPFVITIHDPHEMEVLGPTLIKLCEMADIVTFIGARYMEAFVAHGYLDGMDTKARHIIQPYTRRVPADKAWVKERRVVCTSAWRPVKRIDLITRAAELLPMEGPEAVVPLEFWSGDGVDYVEDIVESLPGYSNCVDKGDWTPNLMDVVYGSARALINLTHFDPSDTGRTEYPILEAWDYQVVPVVAADFVGDPVMRGPSDQHLQHRYNCIVVEPEPEAIAAGILDAMELHLPSSRFSQELDPHADVGESYTEVYEEAVDR